MDSSTSSSPPLISTSVPWQAWHAASLSVLSPEVPQSRHVTMTGTVTTSTAAPSAAVPAATNPKACAIVSGSTACRTPQRTRMPVTGRPAARVRTASSTPSHSPNSCTWNLSPYIASDICYIALIAM